MKGTEKQIAFAERLVNSFDEVLDSLITECPDQHKAMWIEMKKKIDDIFSEAYAGDVIDILESLHEEDSKKYFISFMISVRHADASAAKRISKEVFDEILSAIRNKERASRMGGSKERGKYKL